MILVELWQLADGLRELSPWVRVVNSPWNGPGLVKRKVANHCLTTGRGRYIDPAQAQMLLAMGHQEDIAGAARASIGYNRVNGVFHWGRGISTGRVLQNTER